MARSASVVSARQAGRIAWVTIDNPPVNATSVTVRQGLLDAVQAVAAMDVDVAVLRCAGRTFVAGGDIAEFDAPPVAPDLPDVVQAIEDCPVPWVAAIHGAALGGGLELALGCAWRVAVAGARVGLPEVTLGIVPGAGGTQRLPRLVGTALATGMVTDGRPIAAQAFLEDRGLDAILPALDEDHLAQWVARRPERPAPVSLRQADRPDDAWWEERRAALAAKSKGQAAPLRNLALVRLAASVPFAEGQPRERATHLELRSLPEARALRHAFFAERAAARPQAIAGHAPREIGCVAVAGGGLMGSGIATALLMAGLEVVLIEQDRDAAQAARARVSANLDGAVRRSLLSRQAATERLERLNACADYAGAAGADLAIEAVFEDVGVKRAVFARLAEVMRPDAILATNTSYLDPRQVFEGVAHPERLLGLHFFSPAHVMKLLEIVFLPATSGEVLATGFALARKLRKTPVLSGICTGFIGNRMLAASRRAADYMLADGALPHEVDAAMQDFGMPMGPYALQDFTGLQIAWATRRSGAATRPAGERYVPVADRLCEMGRFGQRSGKGWYRYDEGSRTPRRDPEVERIIAEYAREAGIARRPFTAGEICQRLLAVLVNEGALICEEGVAEKWSDVDVVQIAGYGFPRWRGGPMHYAQETGLGRVASRMGEVAAESPGSWTLARALREAGA